MKGMFNATCQGCQKFRPRCAIVYIRVAGKAKEFHETGSILCDKCRSGKFRGKYRLDGRHK